MIEHLGAGIAHFVSLRRRFVTGLSPDVFDEGFLAVHAAEALTGDLLSGSGVHLSVL